MFPFDEIHNTGEIMGAYAVFQNVDWLSFSLDRPRWLLAQNFLTNEIKSPLANYNRAEQTGTGLLHLWHSERQEVKHHYIASGETLANLRSVGYQERDVVKWCLENSQISRIDIALTSIREDGSVHGFSPHDIAVAVHENMLVSRLRPSKDIASDLKIETKYIGNRKTRKRLFRGYDKGVENGGEASRLVRYELETRSGTKNIGRMIARGDDYGSIIRKYVDFPSVPVWIEICGAEKSTGFRDSDARDPLRKALDENASRWNWIETSIVPVIRKALEVDTRARNVDAANNPSFHRVLAEIMKLI